LEDAIRKMVNNFIEFFDSLEFTRKIGFIAILLFTITVMVSIVLWASKTQYKVLFTDLNKDDSSKIARLLEEKKIAYQFSEDGQTIKVPEDQVEIWRLELAKQGMSLSGTLGYEIFDKQSFGTSSFVQRVNKQRALEGELIKTIMHIRGVKRARVHLSIPETNPFAREQKIPSSSVVLELDRGVVMTKSEIRGVASLVSSSVEGMRIQDVVIVDDRGKKLSDNIGDKLTADTANRLTLESELNKKYESQVEEILSKVVGEGKVTAKVAVKMDFTQSVTTKTNFDGENTAVLSEVRNVQKIAGSRPSPQGIPGARSNLPGEKPQPGIPETKNNVDKELYTRNYNVPSVVTRSSNPVAKLNKMSVAVMVDGKRIPMMDKNGNSILNDNGIAKTKYVAWTANEIKNFEEIVVSSLGLSTAKGDSIVIRNMEFIQEDLSAAEALIRAREKREIIKNIVKYLSIGLIMTLFFFIVVRPFIQWVTENTVESVEDFLPKTIEELEKIQSNQKLPGLEEALPQIEEKINPEKVEGNMLKEKIITLVENNPSKAAQVLHEMIHSVDSDKQIA
jgi:flagellar M-ring protein FliF